MADLPNGDKRFIAVSGAPTSHTSIGLHRTGSRFHCRPDSETLLARPGFWFMVIQRYKKPEPPRARPRVPRWPRSVALTLDRSRKL